MNTNELIRNMLPRNIYLPLLTATLPTPMPPKHSLNVPGLPFVPDCFSKFDPFTGHVHAPLRLKKDQGGVDVCFLGQETTAAHQPAPHPLDEATKRITVDALDASDRP